MSSTYQTSFTAKTNDLIVAIGFISRIGGKKTNDNIIDIAIFHEYIEVSKPGIMRRVAANTIGSINVSLPEKLISAYLKNYSSASINFMFAKGQLQCGTSVFTSSAIQLSEIPLNKSLELPINPSNLYLLRFANNTSELEINRLNLTATVKKAKRQLKSNIVQALKSLEQYEVAYEDIEALVRKKILKKS